MNLTQLPPEFQEFLKQEGIDPAVLVKPTVRYIRTKPNFDVSDKFNNIKKIDWIPDMYSIPLEQKISDNELYRQGQIYGIDLASAAVVQALDINEKDHRVLDLCCAPGAKLMYIADLLKDGKVTGVDISQNRLNVTRSLVKKYKLEDKVELVQEDGTIYSSDEKFDKVLVDAECTHEGSIKHLEKFIKQEKGESDKNESKKRKKELKQSKKQLKMNHSNIYTSEQNKRNEWTVEDFKQRFLDEYKLQQLKSLQWKLLTNGFKQLKQDGFLIYSTCSYSKQQNEDIIDRFLKEYEGKVEVVDALKDMEKIPCTKGGIEKSIRFDGQGSNSGGMFLIKMKKIKE